MIQGIHLEGKRESSLITWTLAAVKDPHKVRIPLAQLAGSVSTPCVSPGDHVKAGQKIAEPYHPLEVALHASLSGKVTAIASFPHPILGECQSVEIEADEKQQTLEGIGVERTDWSGLKRDEIKELFRDLGLVEMDDDGIPLHWKISDASFHKIRTLVVNLCETEPYLTSDHSLCQSHPVEILRGAEILRAILPAERVVIAVSQDKHELADLLKSKVYFLKWKHFEIRILPDIYPQGHALPLIHSLFEIDLVPYYQECLSESPNDLTPFVLTQTLHRAGISIHNPATLFAVYEAMVFQKPVYQRAVTVTGECVIEPKNFWVPLGLSFQNVIKASRGLMREPEHLLMGGPMRGIPQSTQDVPVLKTTRGILALPKQQKKPPKAAPCIHCSRCVEACPVEISPAMITLASENGLFEEARHWGLETCIDCGNCTYVCPSKRPMAELIELAREGCRRLDEEAAEETGNPI